MQKACKSNNTGTRIPTRLRQLVIGLLLERRYRLVVLRLAL